MIITYSSGPIICPIEESSLLKFSSPESVSLLLQYRLASRIIIGTSYLDRVPGFCGALISTGLHIEASYRGSGYYKYTAAIRTFIADSLDYSEIWATIRHNDLAEKHCITKYGGIIKHTILNRRTGNLCYFVVLPVPNPNLPLVGVETKNI